MSHKHPRPLSHRSSRVRHEALNYFHPSLHLRVNPARPGPPCLCVLGVVTTCLKVILSAAAFKKQRRKRGGDAPLCLHRAFKQRRPFYHDSLATRWAREDSPLLLQFVWFPTLSGLLCVRSLALYSISSRLSPSFLAFLTELYLKIQEQTSNLKEFAAP